MTSPRRCRALGALLAGGALLAAGTAAMGAPMASAAGTHPAPTRSTTYDGGRLGALYDQSTTIEAFSSPVVANVTGHTDGDVDVIAGYADGTLHVWSARTGRQEFVVKPGPGAIQSSPSIFRTSSTGHLAVLGSNTNGEVFAYTFTGGKASRVFYKHVAKTGNPSVNGFFGTPTVADLDKDGKRWIVATSWDQHLYVWSLSGANKPGFPLWERDTIWSSPTVATLDGDPYPEIIFGYDCSYVPGQPCYTQYGRGGGYVTAVTHTGRVATGWPRFVPGQVVWSTPAVADLFANGHKEVIVGTGLYWKAPAGSQVLAFDAHGKTLPGFPVPLSGRTFSSPAIGDVLGTGHPQIAIGSENGQTHLVDAYGHRIWNRCTAYLSSCVSSHSSPAIGDLWGTGKQEVLAVGGNAFHVLDAAGNDLAHAVIPETAVGLAATPTLVNVDGRARLFFCLMAKAPDGRHASVVSYALPAPAGRSAWPMFKHDPSRLVGGAGVYVPNAITG